MAHHKIEFDAACKSCNSTGIYVGMGEHDGSAVVCHNCNGTGEVHHVIEYDNFERRKRRRGIKRIYQTNPGIDIGEGTSKKYGKLVLENFGGIPYNKWFKGEKFPVGSEMRKFTCPAWWYQGVDYDKKPNWDKCCWGGMFKDCKYFKYKNKCWEESDKELGINES